MRSIKNTLWFNHCLLVIGSMIWGFAFVAQRSSMDNIGPLTFNAIRFFLGGLLLAVLFSRNITAVLRLPAATRRRYVSGILLLTIFLTAACACQQIAMVDAEAGRGGFITSLYLIFTPLVLLFTFKEKTKSGLVFAITLALTGMYLLTDPTSGKSSITADILLVFCAVLFAAHIVAVHKIVKGKDPLVLAIGQFIMTGIISGGFALFFEESSFARIERALIPILYAAFISCAIGYTIQVVAQAHVASVPAALILSLEAVFSVIGGGLLLGEQLSFREQAGCLLLLFAVLFAQLTPREYVRFIQKRLIKKAFTKSA